MVVMSYPENAYASVSTVNVDFIRLLLDKAGTVEEAEEGKNHEESEILFIVHVTENEKIKKPFACSVDILGFTSKWIFSLHE